MFFANGLNTCNINIIVQIITVFNNDSCEDDRKHSMFEGKNTSQLMFCKSYFVRNPTKKNDIVYHFSQVAHGK